LRLRSLPRCRTRPTSGRNAMLGWFLLLAATPRHTVGNHAKTAILKMGLGAPRGGSNRGGVPGKPPDSPSAHIPTARGAGACTVLRADWQHGGWADPSLVWEILKIDSRPYKPKRSQRQCRCAYPVVRHPTRAIVQIDDTACLGPPCVPGSWRCAYPAVGVVRTRWLALCVPGG
jgi:hypothetical protein